MSKKLIRISTMVLILCFTPIFVIWSFAQESATYTIGLEINVTEASFGRGKGVCLQSSLGTIMATLPTTYEYDPPTKTIGGVICDYYYGFDGVQPNPLTLDQEITVHIHIDVAFRKLNVGDSANIMLLDIHGCTSVNPDGVQYCINTFYEIPSLDVGNIGTVTKIGSNIWEVNALIPAAFEQYATQGLCVNQWDESQSEVVDGFCIPLYDLEVVCIGTITN